MFGEGKIGGTSGLYRKDVLDIELNDDFKIFNEENSNF